MLTVLLLWHTLLVAPVPGHLRATAWCTIPAKGSATPAKHLERFDQGKLRDLVMHRHGRILLINVWATWCAPCVEEFPDIVRLAREMKNRPIDFVGISADDYDDEISKVLPFIAREKADFKFYIAKFEGEDAFIDAFDKAWGGGIPATFIYDAKGQKKAFLLGKQSYASLKTAIGKVMGN